MSSKPGFAIWVRATRPQFLTVTAVAVSVGLAGIVSEGRSLHAGAAALSAFGALCAHAGANMINDYHDREADALNSARLSPFTGGSRMIQNGLLTAASTAVAGYLLMLAALVTGVVLLALDMTLVLGIGMAGLALAVAYSAPPLRLAARGWGEATVACAWLLVVIGTDVVQRGAWSLQPLALGMPIAGLVAAVLWVNEYPDEAADRLAGKQTLVVRLGRQRAARVHALVVAGAYAWLIAVTAASLLPATALLGLAGLPWSAYAALRLPRVAAADGSTMRYLGVIRATVAAAHVHGVGLVIGLLLAAVEG